MAIKNRCGLTLIELLLVVAIITILAAASTPVFMSGYRLFRRSNVQSQLQAQTALPLKHMATKIRSATTPPDSVALEFLNFTPYGYTTLRFKELTTHGSPAISDDFYNGANYTTREYKLNSTDDTVEYRPDVLGDPGTYEVIGRNITELGFNRGKLADGSPNQNDVDIKIRGERQLSEGPIVPTAPKVSVTLRTRVTVRGGCAQEF